MMQENMFITHEEYSQMLYFDPKGISCAKCHGATGEKRTNISYMAIRKNGSQRKLRREFIRMKPINKMDYFIFERKMKSNLRLMPTYRLTDYEIKSLYSYLTRGVKKKKKTKKSSNSK
jgi:hypothetical protein